jgi:hypothetical protein
MTRVLPSSNITYSVVFSVTLVWEMARSGIA